MKTIFITILILLSTSLCLATEYYVDPVDGNNGDHGLTQGNAWATFAYAHGGGNPTPLVAGDTLYLMDGTFYETLDIDTSGTNGSPISYKALNDGQPIIDGQDSRRAIDITGTNPAPIIEWIVVEGIVAQNSNNTVVRIRWANNIIFRRVSAYNARDSGNYHGFQVSRSTNVLLEDCASSGTGRTHFQAYESTDVTFRRCWGMWQEHHDISDPSGNVLYLYGTGSSIMENCYSSRDPASTDNDKTTGFGMIVNSWNDGTASNNKMYGCISHNNNNHFGLQTHSGYLNLLDNEFIHNVFINTRGGFQYRAGDNILIEYLTVVDAADLTNFGIDPFNDNSADPECDWRMDGVVRNSNFLRGDKGLNETTESVTLDPLLSCDPLTTNVDFTHEYNNYYGIIDPQDFGSGTGETNIDPEYNIAKYGDGAYLIQPSVLDGLGESGGNIGAEVLYRYVDSVLTSDPLWPWPMEDRIFAETGFSVTWEANGGLWKTLDGVYSSIISIGTGISLGSGIRFN